MNTGKGFRMLRFRFGLRVLLGLVLLAAIFSGWATYALNWIRARQEFRAAHSSAWIRFGPCGGRFTPGFLWVFGEEKFCLWRCEMLTPEELEEVKRLFPEARFRSEPNP